MKKTALLTFLILLNAFGTLQAQTLTLQDCIEKSLHSHPDIKHFMLQIRRSDRGIDVARADILPQVSFTGEYDPSKTFVMPANGIFQTQDSDGWIIGVTLNQKIWDFSRTSALVKAQETQKAIAKLSLQDARALLAYKVKLQYELALIQHKSVDVRVKDLEVKRALYEQAQALLDQGLRTQADVSRFSSSVSAAKDTLSIARSNIAKARTVLALYIGETLLPDDELSEERLLPDILPNSLDAILKDSPALKSLEKNIKKTELLHKAAKRAHYGSIDGVASYNHQNTLNEFDTTLVGVMYTLPLYSGGRLSAREEQSKIDQQNAQNDYEAKVLGLKEEALTLLLDLKRYDQTIKAKGDQLSAAQQTQGVVRGRYHEGLATYIEVLDATAQILDARLGLLQADFDKKRTIHRLEYLQGKSK